LREIVRRHHAGLGTRGLVALTFDDAYASLLATAGGAIAREQAPIAVFVVTDAARTGASYWWDRVEEAFAHVSAERWRAFEGAVGLPDSYRVGQPARLGPLRPLRQWTLAVHRGRWPESLEPALAELEAAAGAKTSQRSMTFAELERLAASVDLEIGVHTRSHPVIPLLPEQEVREEIAGCYAILRERFGSRVVPVLAFPFGLFDARAQRISREVGMQATLGLGNRTLRGLRAGGVLPRFSMTAEERQWRLSLKLLGLRDRLRGARGAVLECPPLPSATS
jgi:peptidoglycan/xylan/chitin deacetylase (PgdA/CDA1 family)